MIRVQDLHKRFGEVKAVNGVSFTADDGAVTGLLGPNGAGKTTTLRMLYALMRPDQGAINVDGDRCRRGATTSTDTSWCAARRVRTCTRGSPPASTSSITASCMA